MEYTEFDPRYYLSSLKNCDMHINRFNFLTRLSQVFLKVSTHSDSYQESNVDRPREDSDNGMFRRPESQLLGVSQKDMYGSSFTKGDCNSCVSPLLSKVKLKWSGTSQMS